MSAVPTLRELAREAFAKRQADERDCELLKEAEAARELAARLGRMGIDADPTGAVIELDGITLGLLREYGYFQVRMLGPCAYCGLEARGLEINSLADIGEALKDEAEETIVFKCADCYPQPQRGAEEILVDALVDALQRRGWLGGGDVA